MLTISFRHGSVTVSIDRMKIGIDCFLLFLAWVRSRKAVGNVVYHIAHRISQKRVAFLQTVYKFIFRHNAMVYCSFHSDGLQPPVLSPPPTWLLLLVPSQARLSSQRR